MKLWGSSYLLHDAEPVRLVATLGSWTSPAGPGSVQASFNQEPGVFVVTWIESRCELVMKREVALRLMALVHVLVLENRILRGETPEIRVASDRVRVFNVTGGWREERIVCAWNAAAVDVRCSPVQEGGTDQFELVLAEEAAEELVVAIAESIALNGTRTAREGSAPK